MNHSDIMNSCDEKAQRVGLGALTDAERVVVLVSRANFEIELGGLSAFFYNLATDHADTISALKMVGATRAAEALQVAAAKFHASHLPTERGLRSFGELDAEFYRDQPDVFSRLCTFIEAQAADLREHSFEADCGSAADGGSI